MQFIQESSSATTPQTQPRQDLSRSGEAALAAAQAVAEAVEAVELDMALAAEAGRRNLFSNKNHGYRCLKKPYELDSDKGKWKAIFLMSLDVFLSGQGG